MEIISGKTVSFRVAHEGPAVVLTIDGKTVGIPWDAALKLSWLLRKHGLEAQAFARDPEVVFDQALLIRKGVPLALSADPRVASEALNEAAFNHELRKTPVAPGAREVKLGHISLVGKEHVDGNRKNGKT